MNKIKNKKTLIIILLLIVTIGITIAFFSNSTILENLFGTKEYGTTYTEEFISPDNWLPGDTTDKTLVVTNSGKVDEAVRISYTEEWISKNGTTLSGLIDENGQLTDEEENSERAVIINFSNLDDWTYNDGYYYYKYRLAPNEETSSFIESVTFNPNVTLGNTCTEEETPTGKRIQCNSSGEDYDNATYKLTFTIETVQFNKYSSAWGVDIALAENRQLFCDAFEVGEVVDYKGSEYYVLKDSSTEDDYVTLIKKDPLTADEVNTYSTDYVSQNGEYPYFESDTCNENTQTGCSTNYDTSSVKKIIDGWSSSFGDDLVEIDGYKAGLINEDIFNDYYEYKLLSPSTGGYCLKNYDEITNNIILFKNTFWTNFKIEDSNTNIYIIGSYQANVEKIYNKSYIRPVINLKKDAINGACDSLLINEYFTCEYGDEVEYNNDLYYVLDNSDSNRKFVTLLKKEPLTAEEVNTYSTNYVSQDGEYPYYESDSCNENTQYGCGIYDNSKVKKILDSWSNSFEQDLVSTNGYKARLINSEELFERLYYEYKLSVSDSVYYAGDETPEWSHIIGKPYWTMINNVHTNSVAYIIQDNYAKTKNVYNRMYIRPVINLHKKSIEKGCNKPENVYSIYNKGEIIQYNNEDYCVISKSNHSKDYVTLIKSEPLTYDELVTYNNGYEIGRYSVDNNIGTISYYKSDTCYYNSYSDNNTSGCSNNYNNSFVKNIINNWSSSFSDDLKEIEGYKARLITDSELEHMGHSYYYGVFNNTEARYRLIRSNYECLYNSSPYWTFGSYDDSGSTINIVSPYIYSNEEYKPEFVYNQNSIRPVINLKKCALNNTCE